MLLAFVFSLLFSAGQDEAVKPETRVLVHYPHHAPLARARRVLENYQRVRAGMSVAEVTALLGEADEIRPLYSPSAKAGQPVGHTRWYVLRRLSENGSFRDKGEALVRVAFTLDDRVTAVDAWGLDTLPAVFP